MPNLTQAKKNDVTYNIKDATARQDISDLKSALSDIDRNVQSGGNLIISTAWTNGAYHDTTGEFIPNLTSRVVSKKFAVYKDCNLVVSIPENYRFKVCKWDLEGRFIDTGTWYSSTSYHCTRDYIVSIMVLSNGSGDIDPGAFSASVLIRPLRVINDALMNSLNRFVAYIPRTNIDGVSLFLENGVLQYEGTASAVTYKDLLSSFNSLPENIDAGSSYYLSYNTPHPEYTKLVVYFNHGSGWVKEYDRLTGINKITIPSTAIGMLIRVYFGTGITYPRTYVPVTLSEQPSNRDLMYTITHSGGSENGNSVQVRFLEQRGTGDCAVLRYADGTVLVIDFGYPDTAAQVIENRWAEAVSELDITHIDYAIISHYHGDHCGLLTEGVVDSLIDGQTTFFLPAPFTQEQLSALQTYDQRASDRVYETYIAATGKITAKGCHVVYPTEGEEFEIGGSLVKFWNTDHTAYLNRIVAGTLLDYNPCSICNYITIGSIRMAFTGDISNEVLTDYIGRVLPSQIFKVNHHCTGYDAIPKFMSGLMPELAITECGDTLVGSVKTSTQHSWFELNNVPNIPTGLNKKTLSLTVTSNGYIWNTPCRRLIVADEEE